MIRSIGQRARRDRPAVAEMREVGRDRRARGSTLDRVAHHARRLEEHGLLEQTVLREAHPGKTVEIGPFEIEFIYVTHSTMDCTALAIRTPLGVVIHTGDFKMDPTPTDLRPFDLHAFAEYGQEGVLALLFKVGLRLMRDYDSQIKAGVESPVLDAKQFADLDLDPAVWGSQPGKAADQAEIGDRVYQR